VSWTAPEPPALPPGPDTGEIRPILQGYLDHYRRTMLRLCAGLTADQLAERAVPPSTLSLLGLVRHMTQVERKWLRIRARGEDVPGLYPGPDEDFDDLDPTTAPEALTALAAEWVACDDAVAGLPLDHVVDGRGHPVALVSIYIHLVEEWARHAGHGDLLRQAIDGATDR
jgi:uncharacterized damage-inducible protein DinB